MEDTHGEIAANPVIPVIAIVLALIVFCRFSRGERRLGSPDSHRFAPSLRFAGARTLLGGMVLLLVLVIRSKTLWPEPRLARWILPMGVLATALTFGSMFASPVYTGAGIASDLGNTQPLSIIVLAALLLGEEIGLIKALALGLGLAGVTLMALPSLREQTGNPLLGAMLALGCSVSPAVASVTVKNLRPGNDLISLTAWQHAVKPGSQQSNNPQESTNTVDQSKSEIQNPICGMIVDTAAAALRAKHDGKT